MSSNLGNQAQKFIFGDETSLRINIFENMQTLYFKEIEEELPKLSYFKVLFHTLCERILLFLL